MNKFIIPLALISSNAYALNLQYINHSHSPHYMVTEDTLSKGSLINQRLIISANYLHLNDPLVATTPDRTERTRSIIKGITTLQVGAGWQTSSRFLIGVAAPFSQVTFTEDMSREQGVGDTTVIGKYRLSANNDPTSIALIPTITLPTGDKNLFLSDGGVGTGLKVAMERDFTKFRINGNLGFLRNDSAAYQDINYRNRFLAAIGVHVPINDRWHWSAEGYTLVTKNRNQNPGEIVAGIQYFKSNSLSVTTGLGFGGIDSTTGNDWRFLVGLKWQPALSSSVKIESKQTTPLSQKQVETMEKVSAINLEIRFEHDSDKLKEIDIEAIAKIAELIKEAGLEGSTLVIQGHANRIGEEDYNRDLSLRRARAVRRALIKNGLHPLLTLAVGQGQNFPVKHEDQRLALDMSRRVDFVVR